MSPEAAVGQRTEHLCVNSCPASAAISPVPTTCGLAPVPPRGLQPPQLPLRDPAWHSRSLFNLFSTALKGSLQNSQLLLPSPTLTSPMAPHCPELPCLAQQIPADLSHDAPLEPIAPDTLTSLVSVPLFLSLFPLYSVHACAFLLSPPRSHSAFRSPLQEALSDLPTHV